MSDKRSLDVMPINKSIKYIKKAGLWCGSINYNTENSADKIQWFNSRDETVAWMKQQFDK